MRINLITLKKQIAYLPAPRKVGELCRIEIMDRYQEINGLRFASNNPEAREVVGKALTLVAVEYCYSPGDCWAEWELDL